MIGPGTARVRIRVVAQEDRQAGVAYLVQAGAFRDRERARALSRELERDHPRVKVRSDGEWHRVEIGPFKKRKEAEGVIRSLAREGHAAILRRT
jgi:cell division protein FtsN